MTITCDTDLSEILNHEDAYSIAETLSETVGPKISNRVSALSHSGLGTQQLIDGGTYINSKAQELIGKYNEEEGKLKSVSGQIKDTAVDKELSELRELYHKVDEKITELQTEITALGIDKVNALSALDDESPTYWKDYQDVCNYYDGLIREKELEKDRYEQKLDDVVGRMLSLPGFGDTADGQRFEQLYLRNHQQQAEQAAGVATYSTSIPMRGTTPASTGFYDPASGVRFEYTINNYTGKIATANIIVPGEGATAGPDGMSGNLQYYTLDTTNMTPANAETYFNNYLAGTLDEGTITHQSEIPVTSGVTWTVDGEEVWIPTSASDNVDEFLLMRMNYENTQNDEE